MRTFLRTWEEFDLKKIEKCLIVVGELSSECFSCHNVGIDSKAKACPHCGAYFRYMSFRRKLSPAYLNKVKEGLPNIICIDFEDFKKALGKRDARKLLDL